MLTFSEKEYWIPLNFTRFLYVALSDLSNVLLTLPDHAKHFIIAGDLNINLLANSAIKAQYLGLLEDFYLDQLLSEPTRTTSNSSTLIDHIITTKQTPKLRMAQTCGLSDHRVQIANFDYSPLPTSPRVYEIRAFRRCDWDRVCDALHSAPWQVMSIFDDVNDKWCFFYGILNECSDIFIPLKTVKSKKSKRPTPWFTEKISKLIKLKDKAKRHFEKTHLDVGSKNI